MVWVLLLLSLAQADPVVDLLSGVFDKVEPRKTAAGDYVLVATEPVETGDALAAISLRECLVSFDSFPLSPLLANQTSDVQLVTRLLYERFLAPNDTLIAQWVRSLPRQVTNSFGWKPEALAEMQRANVFGQDLGSSTEMDAKLTELNETFGSNPAFPQVILNRENFLWGYAQMFRRCGGLRKSVWAEAHNITINETEEGQTMGLVCFPLLDLPGYCASTLTLRSGVQLTKIENEWLGVLYAERNFKVGQRFCMGYPHTPSGSLLYLKGITVEKNRFDFAWVEVQGSGKVACPGSKPWVNKCHFGIEYNGLSRLMLQFLREDRVGGSLPAIAKSASLYDFYHNLTVTAANETSRDFLLSVAQYRRHAMNLFRMPYPRSLRELRRDTSLNQALRTFSISTYMIPYNQLEHVDRTLLKMLARELQL